MTKAVVTAEVISTSKGATIRLLRAPRRLTWISTVCRPVEAMVEAVSLTLPIGCEGRLRGAFGGILGGA